MLTRLEIAHLAIVEHSVIPFGAGLNALTGETGAGKSILVDALELILGARARAEAIRHGAARAEVRATFSEPPCLIARSLRKKSSKATLDGRAITQAELKVQAARLLRIHSQHASQNLLKSDTQRELLDRFAGITAEAAQMAQAFRHYQSLEREYQTIRARLHHRREQQSLLRYQLDELEQIAPKVGEFEALSHKQRRLANVETILNVGQELSTHAETGQQQLRRCVQQCARLAEHDTHFAEVRSLLEQSVVYLDEALDSATRLLARTHSDPEGLAETEERMSTLHALARKHHCAPDELPKHWQALAQMCADIERDEERLKVLAGEREGARQQAQSYAQQLHAQRCAQAPRLAAAVAAHLQHLGMPRARFEVEVQAEAQLSESGGDQVHFLLSANPGQPPKSLNKVASGGELSRVSLAIEVVCLDDQQVPTIVFDEIDAGIGGEVARSIGELLRQLSTKAQVLVITHLPQVAAFADHHCALEKISDAYSTQTRVRALNDAERIVELARMLGDARAESSRRHAQTLLKGAHSPQSRKL